MVAAIVAGAAVVALIVTVIVMMARRPSDTEIMDVATPADGPLPVVSPADLIVENELARGTRPQWVPYRPRRDRWSEEDVDEHWIDPAQIGIDVLNTQVEQAIRDLLEDVP